MDLLREPDDEDEVEPGALIASYRWLRGWTQTKLARRARMDKSRICRYESGEDVPEPATLDRITAAAEIRPSLVAPIQSFIRLMRRALSADALVEPILQSPARSSEEAQRAVWGIVERSLSLARLHLGVLWSVRPKREAGLPSTEDWERVETLLDRLRPYDPRQRTLLIQESPAYQDGLLCIRLCDESERAAAHSAAEALEWAMLACDIARQAPGTPAWRSRLQGYAEAFRANALRVGSEYQAAKAAFARMRLLWKAGKDDFGLLDEGRVLDLEASLCRAQRHFAEALKLHDQALQIARPDQSVVILLNKAYTLEEKGDYAASIEILEQAASSIDRERQPRLFFGIRFNLAGNLVRLGRAETAAPIVAEVRELVEQLHNDLDRIRTSWLEAQVLAGLGRREEAMDALEQVRRDFEKRGLAFDYALASLDLALVFREEGRLSEVLELAVEMVEIFEAQGVHREAVAALILFRDAAEKQAVTVDLVQRLQEYLKKARANPKLRFEA